MQAPRLAIACALCLSAVLFASLQAADAQSIGRSDAQPRSAGASGVAQQIAAAQQRIAALGHEVKALLRDIEHLRRQKPKRPDNKDQAATAAYDSALAAWEAAMNALMSKLQKLQAALKKEAKTLASLQDPTLPAAERSRLGKAARDLGAMEGELSAARR